MFQKLGIVILGIAILASQVFAQEEMPKEEMYIKHKTPFHGKGITLDAGIVLLYPYVGMMCFLPINVEDTKEAVCMNIMDIAQIMKNDFERIENAKSGLRFVPQNKEIDL